MASTRAGAWRTHCAWQLERAAQTRLQRAHAPLDMRYRNGLSRAILGDRIADELGLPEPRWKYAIAVTTPLAVAMETVRRHTPGLTELAVRLGERAVERLNEQIAKEAAVTFVPERPAHAPAVV